MKTSLHHLLSPLNHWLLVAAACWVAACAPAHAEKFSTAPQRGDVTKAAEDAAKAADNAQKAQNDAPTDAGQGPINAAEDAADAANDAANRAADDAEHAQQNADKLAKTAKTKDEVQAAKDAAQAAKDARQRAKEAEDAARQAERAAKKAVDDQIKADKGANKGRLPVHNARESKRQTRRFLAKAIRDLDHTWAKTTLNPPKEGVTITEEERAKTQEKLNEGRRALGWDPIAVIAMLSALPPNTLASLIAAHKVETDVVGTGQTIGHIASLRVKNLTGENISLVVPPMVLESKTGKSQHYVCPRSETVALAPQEAKVIKQRGICVSRSKPPVGDGVAGDLAINDGRNPGGGVTFTPQQADKLIRSVASYYDGADKLEKEGKLKKVPYKDPGTRRDIVTQWGVWSDPRICALTRETPATREDLARTVYRQVGEHTPVTPETRKKLDTGITDIFASVQLTSKEAKTLEPASPFAEPPGPVNIDNPAKPGDTGDGLPPPKAGHTPNPLYEWIRARHTADLAEDAYDEAKAKLKKYPGFKHIITPEDVEKAKKEAEEARKKAGEKAGDVNPADRKEQLKKELDEARERAKRTRSRAEDDKKSAEEARADEKRLRAEGRNDLANGRAGAAAKYEASAEEMARQANLADERARAIEAEMGKIK
ncbi:MAG: hypothetical protein HZA91_13650 [Verrucomicrobia bacterium]|nr:hypothetical protein [Verrucomicrobiota bacterium]